MFIKLDFPQNVNHIIMVRQSRSKMELDMQEKALSPFGPCLLKQTKIKDLFVGCPDPAAKYEKIIELGRNAPPFPPALMTMDNLVRGCQSQMYLNTTFLEGKIYFQSHSEALISAGLAALLVMVYNEEAPETILGCPPRFLEELAIHQILSPARSNGLASLFLRMKKEALNFLHISGSPLQLS